MEIDEMRQIPIADFLARLGHEPVRRSRNELWYYAPYRDDRTPSFRVNEEKRLWYDFGIGKGGDIFTLAGEFLQKDDFMEQARFIAATANVRIERTVPDFLPKHSEPVFEDVETLPLLRSPLTDYLKSRGIAYELASRHCCRINYSLHGRRYFAIGFENVAGGYEIRNRFFKGCVPPKDVSLVTAEDVPSDLCNVFEGFMDFLSAKTLGICDKGDCLVLNSVSNMGKAMKYLDGYRRIECFLDRDEAGKRTLNAISKRYGGCVSDRSALYEGCKDLNEYLQQRMKTE